MLKRLLIPLILLAFLPVRSPAVEDVARSPKIQEEIWALPFPLPALAFVVRPVGDGPFPLVIMNHGIALGVQERTMFPMIEYQAAAQWFASRGYFVISPMRYGASSLDDQDRGIFGSVFAHVGSCDNPNFRGPGLAIATLNEWVIDYMSKKKFIRPGKVVVVGQSGGGWGSIALASRNPSSVQAIITFAAGRGGRVDGKPNNNCAPDKLVAATGEFGQTARVPMLWITGLAETLHPASPETWKLSFQLTVLKVLAGQPAGRASVAEIRHAVEILMNSGKDWTDRMKRLAEQAPGLNIFSARFVLRDADGWEITEEGRQFLGALQTAVAVRRSPLRPVDDPPTSESASTNATKLSDPPRRHRRSGSRRRRGKSRSNRRTA